MTRNLVSAWFPVYGHPDFHPGPSYALPEPWYLEHADGLVSSGPGHPLEPPDQPCYEVRDDWVYPVGLDDAWFQRLGSLIYPTDQHPTPGSHPWFQSDALPTWPGSGPAS